MRDSESDNPNKGLKKMEKMLTKLRQEKNEMANKYNTLLESSAAGSNETDLEGTNNLKKKKLQEEVEKCKQKIENYQQSEQRHTDLVQKLQSKILFYKEEAQRVEHQKKYKDEEHFDHIHKKMEEEENRNSALTRVNELLREQLDEVTETNQRLTSTVSNMSEDLEKEKNNNLELSRQLEMKDMRSEETHFQNHQRIINLWNEMAGLRNQFMTDKNKSERDMAQSRHEIVTTISKIKNFCENILAQDKIKQSKMNEMSSENSNLKDQLNSILNDYKSLEENYSKIIFEANQRQQETTFFRQRLEQCEKEIVHKNCEKNELLKEENQERESIFSVLKQISSTIIGDEEMGDQLQNSFPCLQNCPEKIVSSVSAISSLVSIFISRKKMKIDELTSTINRDCEKMSNYEIRLSEMQTATKSAEQKLTQKENLVDSLKRELSGQVQENKRMKNNFVDKEEELKEAEKGIECFKENIAQISSEKENLNKEKNKLQKNIESLEMEKEEMERNIFRQAKEIERCNSTISRQDKNISVSKQELSCTKDLLDREQSDRQLAENQLTQVKKEKEKEEKEKTKMEEIVKVLKGENSHLQSLIEKEKNKYEKLDGEKDKLIGQLRKMEAKMSKEEQNKNKIIEEIVELKNEMQAISRDKMVCEQELNSNISHIKSLEEEIVRLEQDLAENIREKNEIFQHYKKTSRQKNGMTDEILNLQNEIAKFTEKCGGFRKEREKMIESIEVLKGKIKAFEEDDFRMKQNLSILQMERSELEKIVEELESHNSSLSSQVGLFGEENDNLKNKISALNSQINTLLKERDIHMLTHKKEVEDLCRSYSENIEGLNETIRQIKASKDEDQRQARAEMERLHVEFTAVTEEMKAEHSLKESQIKFDHQKEVEGIRNQLMKQNQEHEKEIVTLNSSKYEMSEMLEHQQRMFKKEQQEFLSEKRELENNFSNLRSEFETKLGEDKLIITKLEDEVVRGKVELDKLIEERRQIERNLNDQISTTSGEKERTKSDLSAAQRQIQMLDESINYHMNIISTLNSKIAHLRDEIEGLTNDNADLKRIIEEEKENNEMVQGTNSRLMEKIKVIEMEKTEKDRQLTEYLANLTKIETTKSHLQEEIAELNNQLKMSENNLTLKMSELEEIQVDLDNSAAENEKILHKNLSLIKNIDSHVEREEILLNEIEFYKQNISQLEETLNNFYDNFNQMHKNQHILEKSFEAKERECQELLQDFHYFESKAIEEKNVFDRHLQSLKEKNSELIMSLRAHEGRLQVLEDQLKRSEMARRDSNRKFEGICTVIRRFVGMGSQSARARSSSPMREETNENARGRSLTRKEVDMDDILPFKTAILNFSKKLVTLERIRDEVQTKCRISQANFEDLTDKYNHLQTHCNKLTNTLNSLSEEKSQLGQRLVSFQTFLEDQKQLTSRVEGEKNSQKDKIIYLENLLNNRETEIKHHMNQLEKIKDAKEKNEKEMDLERRNVMEAQEKCCLLEDTNGKICEKLKNLSLLEAKHRDEITNLKKRREKDGKIIEELTGKNSGLQSTTDNLSKTISKFENECFGLKEKIQNYHVKIEGNEQKIKKLSQQVEEMTCQLRDCDKNKNNIESQLSNSKIHINELKTENSKFKDTITALENLRNKNDSKMIELEDKIGKCEEECWQLKHENERLIYKLQEADNCEKRLKTKQTEMQSSLSILETANDDLNKKIEKMKKNLENVATAKNEEKKMCQSWKEISCESEKVQLEEENRYLQTHVNHLNDQLLFMEEDDKCHQMRVFSLQNEIDQLKSELRTKSPRYIHSK